MDQTNRTIRLRAVGKQGGFSIGNQYYEPDADGFVTVPDQAVPSICQYGGFVTAIEHPVASTAPATEDSTGADVPPAVDASPGNPDPVE